MDSITVTIERPREADPPKTLVYVFVPAAEPLVPADGAFGVRRYALNLLCRRRL